MIGQPEPQPKIDGLQCPAHGAHPHDGATCLDCPTCRPPELDLLDLVQQYGLRRAGEIAARGEVAAGLRAAHEALFARIEAEVQRLRTAATPQRDSPLVLSLPEAPKGTRALKGGIRWLPSPDDPEAWCMEGGSVPYYLGRLLDAEKGSVTVEMAPPREPRTWPKISSTEGLPAVVDVKGQGRWKRSPGTDVYVHETEQQGFYSLADLREFGDVAEVIE